MTTPQGSRNDARGRQHRALPDRRAPQAAADADTLQGQQLATEAAQSRAGCEPATPADLGPRQERFVEEYLIDVNAKQAAIRAGYSPKTAEVQGSRLLSNAKVQRAISARMAERSQRTEVAADRVLLEIARVGFSDLRRLFHEDGRLKHPHEWDDDTAASIASVEVVTRKVGDSEVEYIHRIKLWDKGKALEQLSRHLGLYRDQGPSEQPHDRPLSDMSDEELYQRLLDARTRLNRAIEHEQGIRGPSRLLSGGKTTPLKGSDMGAP